MQRGFIWLFVIVGVVLVLLLLGVGYLLGQKKGVLSTKPTASPSTLISERVGREASVSASPAVSIYPTPSPLPSTSTTPQETGIPIKANTVSFTRSGDGIYLRYRDKYYQSSEGQNEDPSGVGISTPNTLNWIGLIDSPFVDQSPAIVDELFSFLLFPDKQKFMFIMRWEVPNNESNTFIQEFPVFYYSSANPATKVSKIMTFYWYATNSTGGQYNIPKIKQVSLDGRFISFNTYECWGCGGHYPETVLFDLQTRILKRIGKVSYFTWRNNGEYAYKDYVKKDCVNGAQEECWEEPAKLPLRTAKF